MFEDFVSGRIAIDGIEIAYVAAGAGEPVLMLHGFPQRCGTCGRFSEPSSSFRRGRVKFMGSSMVFGYGG